MAHYLTRAKLEAVWGVNVIAKWANLENADPAVDADARIAAAITWAEAYFHARVRRCQYSLPIIGDAEVSALIDDVVARLAGQWLYMNRGMEETDESTSRVERVVAFAEMVTDKLINGQMRIAAAKQGHGEHPEGPEAGPIGGAVGW